MNKNYLKKIAKSMAQSGAVNKKVLDIVLSNLSRRDLINLSRYLKLYVSLNMVKVISGNNISQSVKREIIRKFPAKKIVFEIDKSIETGVKIELNDTVIDLSMKEYLNSTIERLKQSL